MPRLDGTGPRGMGPMTGGGRGVCFSNAGAPYNYGAGIYGGAGRGGTPRGGGRGRAWGGGRTGAGYGPVRPGARFYGAANSYGGQNSVQELGYLKSRAASIEQELKEIHRRLDELNVTENEPE